MNEIKKALSNLEPNEKAKERVWEGLERDSKHKRKRNKKSTSNGQCR